MPYNGMFDSTYVVHHALLVIVRHPDPRDHPGIYLEGVYPDLARLGATAPLGMIEEALCNYHLADC